MKGCADVTTSLEKLMDTLNKNKESNAVYKNLGILSAEEYLHKPASFLIQQDFQDIEKRWHYGDEGGPCPLKKYKTAQGNAKLNWILQYDHDQIWSTYNLKNNLIKDKNLTVAAIDVYKSVMVITIDDNGEAKQRFSIDDAKILMTTGSIEEGYYFYLTDLRSHKNYILSTSKEFERLWCMEVLVMGGYSYQLVPLVDGVLCSITLANNGVYYTEITKISQSGNIEWSQWFDQPDVFMHQWQDHIILYYGAKIEVLSLEGKVVARRSGDMYALFKKWHEDALFGLCENNDCHNVTV